MPITLSRAEARRLLVFHHGLNRILGRGARGTRAVLERLRCIQLDPLDVIGTNADLVVMARVDDVERGDVWRHLFPRHAFEHFAKERCILPASAFPAYREQGHAAQTPWWRHGEREQRVAAEVLRAVLDEIREHGPVTAAGLTDHGRVEAIDWSGWKGTSRATSMALEILWTRCDVVVAGRTESGAKLYDIPSRALGALPPSPPDFARWALRERATAAGLLTRSGGSMWSMLSNMRTSPLVGRMIEAGELIEIAIEDSPRRYLAVPSFLLGGRASRSPAAGVTPGAERGAGCAARASGTLAPRKHRVIYDDRVRILGPLDPLLWDRDLVRHVFDFDYVWEVYKPAKQRKWGWYVCPLLHRDRLIGRIDARVEKGSLIVKKLWLEDDVQADVTAALQRHAELCGASKVRHRRYKS